MTHETAIQQKAPSGRSSPEEIADFEKRLKSLSFSKNIDDMRPAGLMPVIELVDEAGTERKAFGKPHFWGIPVEVGDELVAEMNLDVVNGVTRVPVGKGRAFWSRIKSLKCPLFWS